MSETQRWVDNVRGLLLDNGAKGAELVSWELSRTLQTNGIEMDYISNRRYSGERMGNSGAQSETITLIV